MYRLIDQRTVELKRLEEDSKDSIIKDVFGRLVNARFTEGKHALKEDEMLSNCLAFVSASHELLGK